MSLQAQFGPAMQIFDFFVQTFDQNSAFKEIYQKGKIKNFKLLLVILTVMQTKKDNLLKTKAEDSG